MKLLATISVALVLGGCAPSVPSEHEIVESCKPDTSGDCAPIEAHYHNGQYTNGYLDYNAGYNPDPWRGWPPVERMEVGAAGEWSYATGYDDASNGRTYNPWRR